MTELVIPIHTSVKGRTRFRVEGLKNAPALKRILEFYLPHNADLTRVKASTTTGNLLIHHSETLDSVRIAEFILQAIGRRAVDLDFQGQGVEEEPGDDDESPRLLPTDITGPLRNNLRSAFERMVGQDETSARRAWHTLKQKTLGEALDTDLRKGLSADEARRRCEQGGANRLPEPHARTDWDIIFDQVNSLPVYLLGAAAFVSVLTGGVIDALVVMGVVAANAAIGYIAESQADKTISSLRRFVNPLARVIRNGEPLEIPAHEVVIGDLMTLKPGMYVPADCRLLEASHLSVDESMLTGESMPVFKSARALRIRHTPLTDRLNMVFMGTLVTGGQATA
ncbi:MAG: hypothetical protein JJV98_09165, partial [Desulfosarcina sp.]|nr:hypothetical protein [Desulfobacterales bacterium]